MKRTFSLKLSARVLTLELLGGLVGGVLFGFAGGVVGSRWGDHLAFELGGLWIIIGALWGWPVGVLVGVYFVGKRLGQKGSFWFTFFGAVLGTVLWAWGLTRTWELGVWMIAPLVLATLGFNLRLKRAQHRPEE